MKIVVIGFDARGVKVSEGDDIQFFGKRESSEVNCRRIVGELTYGFASKVVAARLCRLL